jgi:predicted hydrocarbon binding protein
MGGLIEVISSVRRPNLGEDVPLVIFRSFRLFSGKYLEEILGTRGATVLFQNAGRELGKEIGRTLKEERLDRYLERIGDFMKEAKVGLLIPESVSDGRIVLSIDECITCSGMKNIGRRICHFETGIVAGLVETFLGKRVKAYETKCNAMGEGICEVTVEV